MFAVDHALVVGSSGGVGEALVQALRADPAVGTVHTRSRRDDGLDVRDEASVEAALRPFHEAGLSLGLVVVATGALSVRGHDPERTFRRLDPEDLAEAFLVNAVGPALVFKHSHGLLPREGRSVFAALSARIGSIGDNRLGGWMSYRASKAALNQLLRCAAVEVGRRRPEAVVLGLHPGTVDTPLTRRYARGRYTHTPAESAAALLEVLGRATPAMSGGVYDYAGERIPD